MSAIIRQDPQELALHELSAENECNLDCQPVTDLLNQRVGINFGFYRPNTVGRRISRRMAQFQIDELSDYLTLLSADQAEVDALVKELLIGVTEFFRDPAVFSALGELLFKLLKGRPAEEGFRIWSAGCAAGEEPYSLAMLLHETAQNCGFGGDLKVFATDVHKGALEFASRGTYNEEQLSTLPNRFVDRYFRCEGSAGYRIDPLIRRMMVFAYHNLISDPPFTRIDLAVCRNLLIYLLPEAQKRALASLHFSLNPSGVLLLGPSEGISHLSEGFSSIDSGVKLFRKNRSARDNFTSTGISWTTRNPHISSLQQGTRSSVTIERHLLRDYDMILERFAPPGLLLNGRRQVLHVFGDLTEYLRPLSGRVNGDLPANLRDELRPALSTALLRAEQNGSSAVVECVPLVNGDSYNYLDIVVTILAGELGEETHFYVCLRSSAQQTVKKSDSRINSGPDDCFQQNRFSDLEKELHSTRYSLQLTIEELQSSNERLDLANEELISSNEELQSTNEELKSVNEDLYAVNTELESRNEELQRLNRDHDNLLASTEVGTVFLDNNLLIRKFSSATRTFMKLMPQDIGRPIEHISYELGPFNEFRKNLQQVLNNGIRHEQELKSDSGQWVLQRILPFKDENNKLDGLVLTFTDISLVKQAQAAVADMNIELERQVKERTRDLAASEAKSRSFIENSGQGFWQLGADRLTIDVNPSLCAMLGYTRDDMLGHSPIDFVDSHNRSIFIYQMGKIDSVTHRNYEISLLHKDGHSVPVVFSATTHRKPDGTLDSSFAFITELTQQKRVEQEILAAKETAEAANRAKTQFLANISHEIRTPLNGVMGMSHLLNMTQLNDEQREFLHHLDDSAQSLLTVINDLLDLTRIESGRFIMEQAVFNLEQLAFDVIAIHRPVAQRKGVKLQLELNPSLPQQLSGVPSRLRQVLHNLLGNAVKFTDQGKITLGINPISVPNQPARISFDVSDTGIGIEPDTIKRIFEPFCQADESISRRYGGTGLGLTICRRLTELMKGSIEVKSSPGEGSSFKVILPMRTPLTSVPQKNEVEQQVKPPVFRSLKILLAEDQPVGRLYATRLLERLGHLVTAVEDGKQATRAAELQKFDLVLMDVQMPGVDGIIATGMIREMEKKGMARTPIIALTAHALTGDRGILLEHGFDGYVPKPLEVDILLAEIDRVVN